MATPERKRKPKGSKPGRVSRIYETIEETRCETCGDWVRASTFRFHHEGAHPNVAMPKKYDLRSIPLPERIAEYVAAGNYLSAACGAVGVHVSRAQEWIRIGEEWSEVELEEIPEDHRVYRVFRDAIRNAREASQVHHLRLIERAAQDPRYWTAAAWILERTNPALYSRLERLRVGTEADLGPARQDTAEEDPDAVKEIVRLWREAGVLPSIPELGNGKDPK